MNVDNRLDVIDGLRGLAIFAVIYQHAYAAALIKLTREHGVMPQPYLMGNGWMGVSLFFILSGFVLSLPYFAGKRSMVSGDDVTNFYIRRANRLMPLFLIAAALCCVVVSRGGDLKIKSLLLTISTLSMFTRSEFFPTINGPFWSVGLEIWFSLLFPLILFSALRFGLYRIAIAVFCLSIIARFAGANFAFMNVHVNPVKDSVIARIDDFVVGVLLASLYAKGRFNRMPSWCGMTGVAVVLLACYLWDRRLYHGISAINTVYFNNLSQVGFALIIAVCLNGSGALASVIRLWPLRILGAMCYSLYCWHALLVSGGMAQNPFSVLEMAKYWFLLLGLSFLSYRYIEFPRTSSWRELLRL